LKALQPLTALKSLLLFATDVGLQAHPLTTLESLSLRFCDLITDEGLQALQHLTALKQLDLGFCTTDVLEILN
jgi:hypothetical protein